MRASPFKVLLTGLVLVTLLAGSALAQQVQLPPAKSQFLDSNGNPLAAGSVGMYVPNTLTPKATYQDVNGNVSNSNPIPLDSSGEALIYGNGPYRQIVKDALGNTIWDASTYGLAGPFPAWGGTSTGSGNSPTILQSSFSPTAGVQIAWIVGTSNTSNVSLTIGSTAYSLYKNSPAGPVALDGNDLIAGNIAIATYDPTLAGLVLTATGSSGAIGTVANLAAAGTTDLGTVASHNVNITGTGVSITSFGSSAAISSPFYFITFNGVNTLTNSNSLLIPDNTGRSTASGDRALVYYKGSGNWQVILYTKVNDNTPVTAYPPGTLSGCTLSNDGGTPASVLDIAACFTRDSTNSANMNQSSAYTKDITAAWSLGSGGGALDTGVISNATYHIFEIKRQDTGVVDYLASLSPSSPTLPSGYTYFRRIGSIVRSGGSIVSFFQNGNIFTLTTVSSTQSTNPGTSAVTNTLPIPTGLVLIANIYVGLQESGQPPNNYMLVTAMSQTDTTPSTTNFTVGTGGAAAVVDSGTNGAMLQIPTNTSAQIRTRVASSGGNTKVNVTTVGWIDTRGIN